MCCGRKSVKRPKMTRSGLKKRKVVIVTKELNNPSIPPYDAPAITTPEGEKTYDEDKKE